MCIKQIKNDIFSHLLKYFSIINAFSILCLLLIIFLFQLDNLILAEGVLRPTIKETEVIALFSGYITDVCYKNAQLVEENQLLFSQDCSFEKKLLNNYLIQRELYDKYVISCNEILNLINQTTIYTCNFDKKIMKNNADYASFIKQYKTYKNEMEAKEKYFERQRELYPLIISKQELDNIENDFINSKLSFSNWIENQKIEKLEKYATYIEKLRNIELAIFQVQNEIENSSIRATQSGIINEIKKINIGEYINADTVILKIFPVDSELKAIIKVLNSNISKIKLGQKVLLKIPDLPYTKYGKLEGIISLIPFDTDYSEQSYYSVEVTINKKYMSSKKEIITLRVGTKVSAKIVVDANTIFQKFFQKIIDYAN